MYQSAAQQAKQRWPEFEIMTVAAAQGKTLDSVAIHMTYLNYFTLKKHRMNVAISRARHQCFIIYPGRQAFNAFFHSEISSRTNFHQFCRRLSIRTQRIVGSRA